MKRLMLTLSSLTLVSVACGGRVGQNADDGGGEVSGGAGTAGKSTGSGGASGPGVAGSKTGPSGVAGKTSGYPTGGTLSLGGDSGVGGTVVSWGGFGPDGIEACALYCTAYAQTCPQAGFGVPDECTQQCVASLQLDSSDCALGKRDAYECIADALSQAPDDCNAALAIAKRECGGATPQVRACNAGCVATSTRGGGPDGCYSTARCNGYEVQLNCMDDAARAVPCTCSINGKLLWDIATGFEHSKAGCLDEAMFRLCAKELP